jgi:hypothetical protein
MVTVRSYDHIRWKLSNSCGHDLSKEGQDDWTILLFIGIFLVERLAEVLGEYFINVLRTSGIDWGVVWRSASRSHATSGSSELDRS